MKTNYIIIAAGEATRWGNYLNKPKHMITLVDDEPIIHHTQRLIEERKKENDTINVIVKDSNAEQAYRNAETSAVLHEAKLNSKLGDIDKVVSSKHLWNLKERTVLLFGDVFFTEKTIADIVNNTTSPDGYSVFARWGRNKYTGGGGELFALVIEPHGYKAVEEAIDRIVKLYQAGTIKRNAAWELYKALNNLPDDLILKDNIAVGVKWNPLLSNSYRICDGTEDFDKPLDYQRWLARWENNPENRHTMLTGEKELTIVAFLNSYPPKRFIGAELYNHVLFKALQEAGQIVKVVCRGKQQESWEYEGVQVITEEEALKLKADVLITYPALRQYVWSFVRRGLKNKAGEIPPILAIQSNTHPETIKSEKLYKWDGILYNSNAMREAGQAGTQLKKVLYPPLPEPKGTLSKGKAVLLVGASKNKGVEKLFALAEAMPEQEFLLVKGGHSTQQEPPAHLENITVLEHLPPSEMPPLYRKARVLILPSTRETWAMVASEAGAVGVPTTTYEDLTGVIENVGEEFALSREASIEKWVELVKKAKPSKRVQERQRHNYLYHTTQLREAVEWVISYG